MQNRGAFGPGGPTPSLPYAGTSGHSGSAASEERARNRDGDGRTGNIQSRIERYAQLKASGGITVKEVRDRFPTEHHGTLSGALTALHKAGRLQRLSEQRSRCSIYVAPAYVGGRETVAPKRIKQRDEELNSAINRVHGYLAARGRMAEHSGRDVIGTAWKRGDYGYEYLRMSDLKKIMEYLR